MIGKGPWPHDLSQDGRFSAHMAPQYGKRVQQNPHGRFFQKIVRNDHIGEVLVGKMAGVGHAGSVPPVHVASEGGRLLVREVEVEGEVEVKVFLAKGSWHMKI